MPTKPQMTLKLKTATPRVSVVKGKSPMVKMTPAAPILRKPKRKFG